MSKFLSREYLEQQQLLHANNLQYGTSGQKHAKQVRTFMLEYGLCSLLDYGCGKETLRKALEKFRPLKPPSVIKGYDPAIPKLSICPPGPFDLITCTDVLEHVERQYLEYVLADIRARSRYQYFVISGRLAAKTLPDGRNAHITLYNFSEWRDILGASGFVHIIEQRRAGKEEYTFFTRGTLP